MFKSRLGLEPSTLPYNLIISHTCTPYGKDITNCNNPEKHSIIFHFTTDTYKMEPSLKQLVGCRLIHFLISLFSK